MNTKTKVIEIEPLRRIVLNNTSLLCLIVSIILNIILFIYFIVSWLTMDKILQQSKICNDNNVVAKNLHNSCQDSLEKHVELLSKCRQTVPNNINKY